MNRHSIPTLSIEKREVCLTALERLGAGLVATDEEAWYAERLERLARVMSGDLWDSNASRTHSENSEPTCMHARDFIQKRRAGESLPAGTDRCYKFP